MRTWVQQMRGLLSITAVFLLTVGVPTAGVAAESMSVTLDHSLRITLPAGAQRVMIGNPSVVDITVLDPRTAVLLGRGYGATNLLILDGLGRTLVDRQVVVAASDYNRVTVYSGDPKDPIHLENYTCSPRCAHTPLPGETNEDYSRYAGVYGLHSARASEVRATSSAPKVGP
jgi:Pilus formation protein N terminal region